MSRNVDSESAQGAVRLFKAGNQIPIIVAVRGNAIKLYTENLSPASYKVSVGKLLDTDGQLLLEPTATSFNVGSLRGTIPNGFRAMNVVYLAIGDISTTRLCPGEPAPDGTTYAEIVKAVNVETRKSVEFAFDAEGNQFDGPALVDEVGARRLAKFGHMDETLWNRLQESADNDVIDIAVWPKIDLKPVVYEKPNDRMMTWPPPEELERLKVLQRKKAKIVDILNHLGATVERRHATGRIPFVPASLRAVDVYKLAKFDVGLVSYEDCSFVLGDDSD